MIKDTKVLVGLGSKNIEYYKKLGYVLPTGKDSRGRTRIIKENGLWVDIKDLPSSSNVKVTVICDDCGEERKVCYSTLDYRKNSSYNKNGETLCTKCANKRMSGENSGAYIHGNSQYSFYKHNAKRRNIMFELTIDEFEKSVPNNCFYCDEPSKGIDRWDSTIGYVSHNCLPCCSHCNFIKNNTDPQIFIDKIKKFTTI